MDWRRIPSLTALRAFEATARLLSFSAAARELNVTHAAIAQHVRALEAEFGETLVVRSGRGMNVTDKGALLAKGLQSGFETIAQTVRDMQDYTDNRPLNVSLTPAFASSWLMPRIGSFWTEHPDITVNLSPTYQLVDLAKDNFDLAIRFGDGRWPGCDAEFLTKGDLVVIGHPDLINNPDANSISDVAGFTWFFEQVYERERRMVVAQEGFDLDAARINTLASSDLVFAAVSAKLGVSAMTHALVKPKIDAGELQAVCYLETDGLGYHLVTRKGVETQSLKVFKKWLLSAAQNDLR